MADPYIKPYLDSSVFIAWIRREEQDGIKRHEIVQHIIEDAADGRHPIIISGLTFAEVHKVRGDHKQHLSDEEDVKILAYFEQDFIEVVDVDRLIGEQANLFCRQYNIRPNDAIHLACALRAHCDVALFWDRPFMKNVIHDKIRIEEPRYTTQRQMPLVPTAAPRDVNSNVHRVINQMIGLSDQPPGRGNLSVVGNEPRRPKK